MNKRSGFSLLEVLIGMTLLAGLALGVATVVQNMMKGSKTIDLRTSAQNFTSLVQLYLSGSRSCRGALGITYSGNDFASGPVIPTAPPNVSLDLPKIRLAEKDYPIGTDYGGLRLDLLNLNIGALDAGTTDWYSGRFSYGLTNTRPDNAMGADNFQRGADMKLKLKLMSDGTYQISDCFAVGAVEKTPQQTCEDLGGRWLRNPIAGQTGTTDPSTFSGDPNYGAHFMSSERCSMGGELILSESEAPVGIPLMGGSNTEGERVSECYYEKTGQTTIKTYLCLSGFGTRAGYRCVYVDANGGSPGRAGRWERRYFTAGGVMSTNPAYTLRCTRGVKVSTKAPDTEMIGFEDPITEAFNQGNPTATPLAATNEEYWDRLGTVESCTLNPQDDKPSLCKNASDMDAALRDKAGSCVYVSDTAPIGPASSLSKFDPPLTANVSHAPKGWYYIHPSYSGSPTYSGSSPAYRSPRGWPCFTVKVNVGAYEQVSRSTTASDPTALNLAANPTRVSQCIYQAPDKLNSAVPRATAFVCHNEDLDPATSSGYTEIGKWVGDPSELYDHDDDGCALATKCTNGGPSGLPSPDDIYTGPNYGTKGISKPQLKKGTCWFFNNVKIATYFVGAATAPSMPATTWTRQSYYTGWVYLNSDLPDNKFEQVSGTQMIKDLKPTPTTVIQGYPCSGGVRYQN